MVLTKLTNVYFLGTLIKNIKGIYNKVNEIIDYVNTRNNYEELVCQLNQTGTDAPTMTVLSNTFTNTTFVLSYLNTGIYSLQIVKNNSNGQQIPLNLADIYCMINNSTSYGTEANMTLVHNDGTDGYDSQLRVFSALNNVLTNGILFNQNIIIRLYNN